MTAIPTGTLSRDAALPIFKDMVGGDTHPDPTQLFSQLKALKPPALQTFFGGDAMGGVSADFSQPQFVVAMLIANTLAVPLQQNDDAYFDCGECVGYPAGSTIPAASDDEVAYGLYVFASKTGLNFYGANGVVSFKAQGTALPFGLTVGWYNPAMKENAWGCNIAVKAVSSLGTWYDQHVQGCNHRHLAVSVNATSAECRMWATGDTMYCTLAVLVTG